MSATVTTITEPMFPIRRAGRRGGTVHAARVEGLAYRTACGELLWHRYPSGVIERVPLVEAWDLIEQDAPSLCRRCARVGDSVDASEV